MSTISYSGTEQLYSGRLNSSFGMDFVEVILDPTTSGQPLTLEIYGEQAADWAFNVQLWNPAVPGEDDIRPRNAGQLTTTETLVRRNPDRCLFYVEAWPGRLGLIITRLDYQERTHPIGEYSIILRPDADSRGEAEEEFFNKDR